MLAGSVTVFEWTGYTEHAITFCSYAFLLFSIPFGTQDLKEFIPGSKYGVCACCFCCV